MKDAARNYRARMQRVLDHIDGHTDEALDVDALSAVAAFSKYHFHRRFSELFGLTVHRYIQLVRLKRASYRLAFRDAPILEVALEGGYEGPEAFSRAFRQRLGQTPSAFRKAPAWSPWHRVFQPIDAARRIRASDAFSNDQVRIVDCPPMSVAVLRHDGDPRRVGDSIRRLIGWRSRAGLPSRASTTFDVLILYADPEIAVPEDYRLDLCIATEHPVAPNDEGVFSTTIPGGRCAVLRLIGSSDDLQPAIDFLYADWLPGSGEEPRDFPVYAQRVRAFPDVPENEAVTDIFLPLK